MISRRLTKIQKSEILEAYRAGGNTNFIAEKYSCSTNTINRTVKTLLSDGEYKLLKKKRSKINNEKTKVIDNETLKEEKDSSIELNKVFNNPEVDKIAFLNSENQDTFSEDLSFKDNYKKNQDFDEITYDIDKNFELIEPLLSCFDFDNENQKSDFELLHYENLPETVYMIVDTKVELDLQLISDLPEWSFLPLNELERNAILLFSNQRSAKRSCSRNQRVIKIPNTSIFKLSKPYLISKGITRLILDDALIALDN